MIANAFLLWRWMTMWQTCDFQMLISCVCVKMTNADELIDVNIIRHVFRTTEKFYLNLLLSSMTMKHHCRLIDSDDILNKTESQFQGLHICLDTSRFPETFQMHRNPVWVLRSSTMKTICQRWFAFFHKMILILMKSCQVKISEYNHTFADRRLKKFIERLMFSCHHQLNIIRLRTWLPCSNITESRSYNADMRSRVTSYLSLRILAFIARYIVLF